jgi:hypothetical protein
MLKLKSASFLFALAVALPAAAEQAAKAYVGVAAGTTHGKSYTDTTGKVQGGYWFSDQYGMEVSYFNAGKFKGADLSYKLRVPIADKLDLTAKAGVASTRGPVQATTTSAVVGFGLSYTITTNVRLRADIDTRRAKAGPGDAKQSVRTLTVGVEKAF